MPRYTIEQIYSTTRPDDPERLRRVERMLDAGRGACWLGRPEIAGLVDALPVVTPRRKAQAAWTAIQCPGCAMAWRGAIRAGLCVRAPLLTAVNSRRGVRRRVVLRIRRL